MICWRHVESSIDDEQKANHYPGEPEQTSAAHRIVALALGEGISSVQSLMKCPNGVDMIQMP